MDSNTNNKGRRKVLKATGATLGSIVAGPGIAAGRSRGGSDNPFIHRTMTVREYRNDTTAQQLVDVSPALYTHRDGDTIEIRYDKTVLREEVFSRTEWDPNKSLEELWEGSQAQAELRNSQQELRSRSNAVNREIRRDIEERARQGTPGTMDHDTVTIPENGGDAEFTFCDNESGDSDKGEFYGSIESHCADLEQSIDLHHNQVIAGGASSAWTHTWSGNQIEVLGSGEDDVQIKSTVEVDGKLETALGSNANLNLSFELYDITNDARSEYTILSHNVGGVGYEVHNNETMHTTAYPTLEAGNEYRLETHLHIEANAISVGSTVASFGHCGAMWPATVDHHVDSMCFEIRF